MVREILVSVFLEDRHSEMLKFVKSTDVLFLMLCESGLRPGITLVVRKDDNPHVPATTETLQ